MKKVLCAATLAALVVGTPLARAGVYLRLDGGGAFSTDMNFTDVNSNAPNSLFNFTFAGDAGTSPIGSVGIGYRFTPVVRFDLTGSYVPNLVFLGHDVPFGIGDTARATIRSQVALVNGYFDFAGAAGLPPGSVEPYLVASIGASRNQLGTFVIGGANIQRYNRNTMIDVAWGVGAGFGIPLGRVVTLDFMYKYLDLGEVRTSVQTDSTAVPGGIASPVNSHLHLHTITAGFRFEF